MSEPLWRPALMWHVAVNVFKESVRDKVPYGLAAFAVFLAGASCLLGQITAGQDVKIIKDLGLAAIATFGLITAVFIGVGLVWNEVERRSIHAVLSKPVRRSEVVLGKFAGLALTLSLNMAVMTVVFYAVVGYMGAQHPEAVRNAWPAPAADPWMLLAIGLILMELLIVTGLAVFFSTFSGPYLSAVLTLALWFAGHSSAELRNVESVIQSGPAVSLARGMYYVLPNLAAFDVKAHVVHAVPIPASYVATTVAYGVVYVALLLTGAVVVFGRRDLK